MAAKETELHAPIGRDGEGLYTASTKGCFDVIDAATPAVLAQASGSGASSWLSAMVPSGRANPFVWYP